MRYAGAVGGRGRVAFSPAMVAGRPGSGAGRAWLRAHATARPWRRWPAGHRQRAEPSRAGAPRSWRRALVACLLCFGALCFGAPVDTAAAQEPEITTFLDNTISGRRSCGARRYTSDITVVQGFNTGGHRTGYTLREIEFEVEGHPDSFTVYPHITLAEASPLFVSEVATLTYNRKRSVDYAHSVNTMVTYTVPEDVTLDPLVAYYLKFASPGQAGYSIAFSRKKAYRVERPNQYGWSMVSTLYWQRSGWNYYNHTTIGGIPCGIRITAVGYRNVDGPNRLPTSANGRIAAGQGRDYVFGRSDFTFSDPDTLDPFSGLEITSLPDSGAGTLKLDGSALGAQDLPKTVTRSELDSGKFVYTPPSGEPEENIASFGFKVSDGMATSDSSYTMSISRVLPRAVLVSIEPTSTPTRWRPGTESGSSAPDTYGNGDIVEITATFDGDITVSDVPQFMFRYRGDIWLGHNKYFVHSQYDPVRSAAAGRNKAVFTYRVTDPSEFTPGNTGIQIVRKAPCCPGGNPFRLYGEDAIDSANGGGPARLGIANDTVYFGHKFNAGLGSRPPENQAPTSAIGRVTAAQGAEYAFSVSDFGYHDEDGDLLAAIKIVSPPTAGELLLDGSAVAAGASVTRAELDEGALTYRAPEEATGADVASFTFKVSDGLHESATDYAMNIDVQASGQQVEVDAPTIDGTPRVSGAGDDGRWTQGETVRVTIPFSEAVEVDTSGGTPSVGIDLGGTATRSAAYRSGSGTAELVFDYTLVQDDGAHSTMAVTPNTLALNGGTIRGSESQADAQLAHNGAVVQGGSDRDDGPEASFRNVPKSHDGESGFTVGLQFSGEPSGLSAKRDAASVLELTGGTVTGAREVAGDANPAWEVTVAPDGPGDIMLRLPARACDETHAVCIEGEPLDEAVQAMVPGTPLTAQFTQAPETHDGSNAFEVDMDFSHEPAGFSYRTVRDALFDVEGGRIERAQRRERGRNRLWRIRVVPETSGDVTLAVRATTDCAAPYAACGANGRKLAGNARLTVRGPASPTAPAVSVAPPAATPVTEGAALGFALTRTGETTQALTVTVSVTETGTTLSGTPPASATFAAGSDRAVLSVATEDDEASETASTVTATVSPGEGYTVEDASASAQAVVEDDDAVPVVSTASPIVVAENRTAVATLAATDADTATEALAWSIPEGEAGGADAAQFTLSAEGVLAFRAAKDFEAPDDADGDGDYEVTVRVTDGTNAIDTALVVRLAGTDDAAPVVSTASPIVVAENRTAVATLAATDADTAAEALAWSLPEGESGGTDAAQFTLSAEGALAFRAAKDFEAPDDADGNGDYEVTVRVTDGSNPVDVPLVVRLADVEDAAPAVSTASPIVVAENQTAVATLTATDADTAAEALAWSLPEGESGGTDAAQFTLSAEGALAFRAAKDFEAPDDADGDGDYEVTVRVTDGTNAVDTALVVRLADVDDAAPSLSGVSVDGRAMALAFDEPLDEESVPPASSFAVIADGSERPVDAVEVSGGTVVVTFSPSARAGETVTVGYTVPTEPGTAPLRDAEGNRVASFASAETENRTTLPVVSIGAASTPVTEGAAAAFVLTRTGATAAALTVAVSVTEAGSVVNGATPSSATFAAGASEARLSVATVNDGVHETDARLTASIQGADGYEVEEGARSAVVDVFDDDAAAPPATELWSSTLAWTDLGNNWFGGFAEAFSDPEWTEGGQDFRIWYIAYDAGSRELSMAHRGVGGVIGEPGQLALHVGGLTIGAGDALSAFARAAVARAGGIASQWRAGEQVSVRLTRTVGEAAPVAAGPGLSVADAQVNESAGVPLRFRVTLNAPAQSAVSVRYRTADGSARAVADYAPAHGAVRFAPGETAKTVAVAVVKDTHDEGSETMTLTLYRPSGASIGDGAATGTIVNTGPMPKAWIARFGRTVAEQAVEAVEARFEAARAPGLSGSIAGQQLSGPLGAGAEDAEARAAEMETRLGLETLADWLSGKSGEEADAEAFESRTLTGREVLAGSTFALTGGTAETGLASFWGRGAVTRFDGREGELSVDGEVASAMLGADWTRDRVLAGLMLSHSRGEGGYRDGSGTGEVESTLTALFPYAHYALSERVSVWGMAGYGEGTLTLTPEGQAPLRPDMDLVMGAVGARGVLVEGGTEGPTLAATSDAFAVRTSTDAVSGSGAGKLAAAQADVTRVRLGLEGSQPLRLGGDAVLTPSLELGVRHDGGDAETGFGADIGAGLALAAPSRGLSAELRARGLLTHEADGMRERGVSGTLAWDPAPDSDRGLSLSLSQTVGAQASGGADALLARPTLAGLGADEDEGRLGRRLEAQLGYGLGVFDDRWTATPKLGLGLSDTGRELRLGWRLTERVAAGLAFELGVEATRREDGAANPEHGLEVGLGWRLAGARASHAAFEMRLQAARRDVANDDRAPEDTIGLELTARW